MQWKEKGKSAIETSEGDARCKHGKPDGGDERNRRQEAGRRASLGAEGRGVRGCNLSEKLGCSAAPWVCLRQSQPSLLGGCLETDERGNEEGLQILSFLHSKGSWTHGSYVWKPHGTLHEVVAGDP